MSMEISFVPVKPEEAHLLSEFRKKVWETTYRGIYPDKIIDEFDFEFHDSRNLAWINSKDFLVYFITANGEKAGYLILRHKNPLYVQSLYLLSEFRRKGIGKKTFDHIREHCRKDKIKKFYLGCHPENKNALAFYEKMGGMITEKDLGHKNNCENSFKIEFEA